MQQPTLYKIGDIIPQTGMYICIPCGLVVEFSEGEPFPTCDACFAGTPDGPTGYQEPDAEFWQLFDEYLMNPAM